MSCLYYSASCSAALRGSADTMNLPKSSMNSGLSDHDCTPARAVPIDGRWSGLTTEKPSTSCSVVTFGNRARQSGTEESGALGIQRCDDRDSFALHSRTRAVPIRTVRFNRHSLGTNITPLVERQNRDCQKDRNRVLKKVHSVGWIRRLEETLTNCSEHTSTSARPAVASVNPGATNCSSVAGLACRLLRRAAPN